MEPYPIRSISDQSFLKNISIRIAFAFLVLLILPVGISGLFQTHDGLHFQDIFRLTTYIPHYVNAPEWGWQSFANIGVAFGSAVLIGSIWYFATKDKETNTSLCYWVYVIARYRLAFGMIGYGVIKLFPLQFPDPSLSDLNTAYGDLLPWKIYYLTVGYASAGYEPVLGLLEILGAVLLLFRKTATFGVGLLLMFLINIVAANFAYQLGDHVYSIFLLLLALIVLAPDALKLFDVLVLRKPTEWLPAFELPRGNLFKKSRFALKVLFSLFAVVYIGYTYAGYKNDNWPYPKESAVAGSLYGLYNVKEFRLNEVDHPYSNQDKVRWQDVVFEKWNTVSVRRKALSKVDLSSEKVSFQDRKFEYQGNGGRDFFTYSIDTLQKSITLVAKIDSTESYKFHYYKSGDSLLHLSGRNGLSDSLDIVLQPIHKKYLLKEGRRKQNQKF